MGCGLPGKPERVSKQEPPPPPSPGTSGKFFCLWNLSSLTGLARGETNIAARRLAPSTQVLRKCYCSSVAPFFLRLRVGPLCRPSAGVTSGRPHPAATAHSERSCAVALIGNGFLFSAEQSLICTPHIPVPLGKRCLCPGNVLLKHAPVAAAQPHQRHAGIVSPGRREPCLETGLPGTCLHRSPKPIAFLLTDQFQFLKASREF